MVRRCEAIVIVWINWRTKVSNVAEGWWLRSLSWKIGVVWWIGREDGAGVGEEISSFVATSVLHKVVKVRNRRGEFPL